MSNLEWFVQLIGSTFTTTDNEQRRALELQVSDFISSRPDEFVLLTAQTLASPDVRPQTKQFAKAAFMQTFRLKKEEQYMQLWVSLKPETTRALLNAAFEMMVSDTEILRRQGAGLLAQLYLLDVTNPKPTFGNTILSGLNHNLQPNGPHRAVSVLALSQICQEMNHQRLKQLPSGELDILLGGIAETLKITDESPSLIVKSVAQAMSGLALKFDNEDFFRFLLERIVTFLNQGINSKDLELVYESVNCLGQIVKYAYHKMAPYFDPLFKKMFELETINDRLVRNATCEFWVKCLRFEETRKTGFFDHFWEGLLRSCFQRLLDAVNFAPEEQETSLNQLEGISRLLNSIVKHYYNHAFPHVAEYVNIRLGSTDPHEVVAAIMALEAVVDLKGDVPEDFSPVFPRVFSFAVTQNPLLIKIVALNCVNQMLKQHISVIFTAKIHEQAIEELLKMLTTIDETETGTQLKMQACSVLDTIASKSSENNRYVSALQSQVSLLMDVFLKVFTFTAEVSAIDAIFASLFDYLNFVLSANQLNHYIPVLYQMFTELRTNYQGPNQQMFMESIIVDINVALSKLINQGEPILPEVNNPNEFLSEMLKSVAQFHDSVSQYSVESLTLMTTILTSVPKFFEVTVFEFYTRYVKQALVSTMDASKMTGAVLSFTALIRVFPQIFRHETRDFLLYLLNFVLGDFPRETKIPVYYFVSDIMINDPELARPHATRILEMDRAALERIVSVGSEQTWDEATLEFCSQFKDVVFENLFCFLHGLCLLNDPTITNAFESEFKRLQDLMAATVHPDFAIPPTQQTYKTVFNFLLDSTSRLRNSSMVDGQLLHNCFSKIDINDHEYVDMQIRYKSILGHKI